MKSKEEYVRAMQAKLDEWNADIDMLTARAAELSEEARVEVSAQIVALKEKQAVARQKIEELQKSGESAWQDLKSGLELAWSAIGEAVDSAKSRFR